MKILITGGAGYIGSVIANNVLQNGHKVRVVDALWYEKNVPLVHFNNPDYEFRMGDITSEATLNDCLEGIDYIIHTAAIVGEPASKKFPELTSKINYEASINLINKAKNESVKGFIFLSTCSNYGMSEGLASEKTPLQPLSLYAETKVNVEKYLMNKIKGIDWVICRLSTAYGVSQRMRFDLTVNDFTMNSFTKRNLDIYLPYTYRPYIHIFDIAKVLLRVIENFESVKNNVFNVGFEGENYQKIKIADIVKKSIPELKLNIVNKGADKRDYQVDFSKLKNLLNVEKTYTIEDGVKEVIELIKSGIIEDFSDPKYYNVYPNLDKSEAKTKIEVTK